MWGSEVLAVAMLGLTPHHTWTEGECISDAGLDDIGGGGWGKEGADGGRVEADTPPQYTWYLCQTHQTPVQSPPLMYGAARELKSCSICSPGCKIS